MPTKLPPRPLYIRILSRLSIRDKILVVTMITSFFAMLVTSATFITYQYYAFQDWLLQNLTSQAEIIAYNSKGALAFDDPREGRDALRSLEAVSSMTGAFLFTADGVLFSSWQRLGSPDFSQTAPDWQGAREVNNEVFMARRIMEKELFLGTILLRSNQQERAAFLRNSMAALVVLVLLSGAITLLLSTWLQKIISGPVAHLATVMEMVSQRQDYSVRGTRHSDDEIGDLTDFFNNMLAQVESRDRQLRENEDLLQSIINNTNSVIYLKDMSGRFLMVNRSFREMVVTNYEDIIGRTDAELFPAELAEKFVEIDQQVVERGELVESEEEAPHSDGLHTYISAKFPLRDSQGDIYSICGISTDITERKQDEEELRQLRNYLNNVIDSMPSALIGLDADGRVTRWNREAEQLNGLTFAETRGALLRDVLPQFSSQMEQVQAAIRDRQVKETSKFSYNLDGENCFKDVTIYPLVANGIEGAVLRVDDVTERVQIEEMMVQTEKMMSVGGLAAGMAHEINNPLGIMVQAVQNIERRVSPGLAANEHVADDLGVPLAAIHAYLDKRMVLAMVEDIREAGNRAAKIVANMLQFSRRSESALQYAEVAELIDQTVELAGNDYDLKKKYDFRHLNLVRNYDHNVPKVKLVITEFEQVVLNLLKNAAQAFADKEMGDEIPTITLGVRQDGKFVRVEVADNGPGIPEEVRKRVFEPFFTTKPVGSGTGLGLSVSYMIITNNHKGSMEVESTPGVGSVFTIRLPIAPAS